MYEPVPIVVQVQRYRVSDSVVVEAINLATTLSSEYDRVLRELTTRLREGETTRAVTNDSRLFACPFDPLPEDEQ